MGKIKVYREIPLLHSQKISLFFVCQCFVLLEQLCTVPHPSPLNRVTLTGGSNCLRELVFT